MSKTPFASIFLPSMENGDGARYEMVQTLEASEWMSAKLTLGVDELQSILPSTASPATHSSYFLTWFPKSRYPGLGRSNSRKAV